MWILKSKCGRAISWSVGKQMANKKAYELPVSILITCTFDYSFCFIRWSMVRWIECLMGVSIKSAWRLGFLSGWKAFCFIRRIEDQGSLPSSTRSRNAAPCFFQWEVFSCWACALAVVQWSLPPDAKHWSVLWGCANLNFHRSVWFKHIQFQLL